MATVTGDIIRVVAGYSYGVGGRPMSNVLHLVDTGPGGIPDPDLLVAMGVYLELVFLPIQLLQSSTLLYTDYTVYNDTQSLVLGTQPWPTFTAGGFVSPIDASQVVGLLRMPTIKSKVQGRVNIVGIAEANISIGVISPGVVAGILSVGANLLLPFVVGPSVVEYTVFNQVLKTNNIPNSAALGDAVRSLGRRKIPA